MSCMKSTNRKSTRFKTARDPKSRAVSFVGNIRSPIRERFGAALNARRASLRMTQEELAKAAGINRTYLSEIENGHENISLERAEKLAHALDCKLSDLLGEE